MNGPTFETDRIQELRNERIQLQKKTFTKWVNAFLDKSGSLVEDLFDDLSDGKKLIRLLEIISGEKVGAIARGKHRIHKLENVSKALQFLQKSVKLESIGPEDVVDGKEDLILGLIWMIILRFQISDVQKEQESKDAKSAKEALLLWCQRKTKGYKGVDVKNFTSSWKNGLAFNALLHSHRPDLFDYNRLQPSKHTTNLQHAFDLAHEKLGIARLLDPEDVDCAMPDEKSVMTYVAMLYQYFAKMKSEETGGRRIAKILGNVMEIERMKDRYVAMVTELLAWISQKTAELQRALPNRFLEIQEESTTFKLFRIKEKPPKYTERMDIEAHFFCIQTKINANKHKPYHPPEGTTMSDINGAWNKMQEAENKREIKLREELVRHEKLARLVEKFNSKADLRESWLEEIFSVLASESQSAETVLSVFNRHKTIEADVRARVTKFEVLKALCAELEKEKYEDIALINKRQHDIESRWNSLLSQLDERSQELKILQSASSIREDIEGLRKELKAFESILGMENYGQHLPESEDLLQRHLVIEAELKGFGTKLPDIDKKIDNTELGMEEPDVLQGCEALKTLYKSVNLLASQRGQRLQAAIERHRFLDSVREELTFVKEKHQLAASKEVGKDLIGLTRLQKKHQALAAEVDACSLRCESLKTRGKDLECVEQKADQEVKRLLRDLGESLDVLKESIDVRSERLSEAAQSFQYYSDANDAESWLQQQISIASNEDFGRDIESTETLLQAHEKVLDEIKLFAEDLLALQHQCKEIEKVDGWARHDGGKTGSLETERGDAASDTVLSDTDEEMISEEPQFIEKEVEREVVKEIKVNQAVSLYPYKGQGLSLEKGETVFVIKKTNDDWWTVRRASNKEIGYAPAKYLKETAPRIVRKVTKEKVKVQERVPPGQAVQAARKTSKAERKGSIQRNSSMSRKIRGKLPKRKRRFTAHFDRENVTNRQLAIAVMYDKLKKLGEERKRRLSDSLAYYRFCDEKEDTLQWILEKDSCIQKSFKSNDLQALQNLVKKVSTDILAYQDSVMSVLNTAQSLLASDTAYRELIASAKIEITERWEALRTLLDRKTSELREKYGVDIFSGKCKEAEQWLVEKLDVVSTPQQLEDLETIRALQRRHLNFEREMSAFEESVAVLDSDCKRLCEDQPASSSAVTRSLQSLKDLLQRVKGQAAAKRKDLENAYGLRGFMADYREIMQWSAETQNFLLPRVSPTSLVFVREQITELEEKHDEAKVYLQRAEDLVKYGRKLLAINRSSSIEECIEEIHRLTSTVPVNFEKRRQFLERNREFLTYLSTANADWNACKAQQTIVQSIEEGNTSEVVEGQLKKLNDVLQKILQLESKFNSMSDSVQHFKDSESGYEDRILDVQNRVKEAISGVKRAIQDKESSLLLKMDFIVFQNEAEEFLSWIGDKLLLAKDQSFLDKAYVQGSILKQEALQAEVAANEKGKEDIIAAAETMVSDKHPDSAQVSNVLDKIQEAWNELKSQCHAKSNQLNAATKVRQFMNKLSDFDIWADQAMQVLSQDFTGNDLSLAKFRRRRLSKLAEELESHENLVDELCSLANELTALSYEKADSLEAMSKEAKTRLRDLRRLQSEKEQLASQHVVRIDLLHDITDQINWVQERLDSLEAAALGDDILETQRFIKRQEGTEVEFRFHKSQILAVIKRGRDFLSCAKTPDQELYASIERLELSTQSLEQASKQRKDELSGHLKLLQCSANIEDAYHWIKDKIKVVEKQTFGHDLASAEAVVLRCRSLESDIDLYKGNILAVTKEIDETMAERGRQRVQLEKKKNALLKDFEKLQKFCQQRCKVLSDSLQFYQFFSDAENVQKWIVEKFKQVSVDSLGSDWEDNQILEAQLSEFKMSLATGVQDYESCLNLAREMVESKHSQSKKIEETSQKLRSSFEKLKTKIKQREDKLLRAGELHKFNMVVADALSRIKEKHAAMSMAEIRPDLPGAERMVRRHKGICLDLNTIQQRLQEIQTDMNKLQPKFVGQTLQQLTQYGNYVIKAFSDLLIKSRKIEYLLVKNVEYLRFDKELQSLLTWSEETLRSVSTEVVIQSVVDAEMALTKLEDLKVEIDGKEDKFTQVCTFGENLIQEGHAKKDKVQDNLERLLSAREELHQAWVNHSELYAREHDFQILCREARKLESTIAFQMSLLVIPKDLKAVEEYEKIMTKHESYEKIQESVVSRCEALVSFAEELIAAESDHTEEVHKLVINIRKKLENYSCKLKETKRSVQKLKEISNLRSSTTELLSWIGDKFSVLNFNDGDQSLSLATGIQRHKVFRAEVISHQPLFQSCLNTASDLGDCHFFQKYELPLLVGTLEAKWKALEEATRKKGLTLEEEKAKSQFRRDVEFAVLLLRDKLSLVATLQLGSSRENAMVVERRLVSVEKETTADVVRIEELKKASQSLIQRFPTSTETVQSLEKTVRDQWEELQALLAAKKSELCRDQEVFDALMQLNEVLEKVSKKGNVLEAFDLPSDLQALKHAMKKHHNFEMDSNALQEMVEATLSLAKEISNKHAFHREDIQGKAKILSDEWNKVNDLSSTRKNALTSAWNMASFEINVISLLQWMTKMIDQLREPVTPRTVKEAKLLLKKHEDILTEFKVKDNVLKQLTETGHKLVSEKRLEDKDVTPPLEKLHAQREELDEEWKKKNRYLVQCSYLQKFNRDAGQIEAWLSRHAQDLSNTDPGNNLEETTLVMSNLGNLEASLEKHYQSLQDLKDFAANLLEAEHFEAPDITGKIDELWKALEKVFLDKEEKKRVLEKTVNYFQLINLVNDMIDWIKSRLRYAGENFASFEEEFGEKRQLFQLFEIEVMSNEQKYKDLCAEAERALLTVPRNSVLKETLENLSKAWQKLKEVSVNTREGIMGRKNVQDFEAELEKLSSWLGETERSLKLDDHGKDLKMATFLLRQHDVLSSKFLTKSEKMLELENKMVSVDTEEATRTKFLDMKKRFEDTSVAMGKKSQALQEAIALHQYTKLLKGEENWIRAKEPLVNEKDIGSDLTTCENLIQNHRVTENDIESHFVVFEETLIGIDQGKITDEKKKRSLSSLLDTVTARWQALVQQSAFRKKRLEFAESVFKFVSEINNCSAWLQERAPQLHSKDCGNDEESAQYLLHNHEALIAELQSFAEKVEALGSWSRNLLKTDSIDFIDIAKKQANFEDQYRELLTAAEERLLTLKEAVQMFHYLEEADALELWINTKMSEVYNEDCGIDLDQAEQLMREFEDFARELVNNEDRIAVFNGLAQVMLDADHTQSEVIEMRSEEICNLWMQLRYAAQLRLRSLEDARNTFAFSNEIAETTNWIKTKREDVITCDALKDKASVEELSRKHEIFMGDLTALKEKVQGIHKHAQYFRSEFPNMADNVDERVNEMESLYASLAAETKRTSESLAQAWRLKQFFEDVFNMRSWMEEFSASLQSEVDALSSKTRSADDSRARYLEYRAEAESRSGIIVSLGKQAQDLMSFTPLTSTCVEQEISQLEEHRNSLLEQLNRFSDLLNQSKNTESLEADLSHISSWLATKENLLDFTVGESLEDVLEQLKSQDDFESSLAVQEELLNAVLKRCDTFTENLKLKTDSSQIGVNATKESGNEVDASHLKLRKRTSSNPPLPSFLSIDENMTSSKPDLAQTLSSPDSGPLSRQSSLGDNPPLASWEARVRTPDLLLYKPIDGSGLSSSEPARFDGNNIPQILITDEYSVTLTYEEILRHHHISRKSLRDFDSIDFAGVLERKVVRDRRGLRGSRRSWKCYYVVLSGDHVYFYRNEKKFRKGELTEEPALISGAHCELEASTGKRENVVRLRLVDGYEMRLSTDFEEVFEDFLMALNEAMGEMAGEKSNSLSLGLLPVNGELIETPPPKGFDYDDFLRAAEDSPSMSYLSPSTEFCRSDSVDLDDDNNGVAFFEVDNDDSDLEVVEGSIFDDDDTFEDELGGSEEPSELDFEALDIPDECNTTQLLSLDDVMVSGDLMNDFDFADLPSIDEFDFPAPDMEDEGFQESQLPKWKQKQSQDSEDETMTKFARVEDESPSPLSLSCSSDDLESSLTPKRKKRVTFDLEPKDIAVTPKKA